MIPEQKAILERAKQPETSTVRELMDERDEARFNAAATRGILEAAMCKIATLTARNERLEAVLRLVLDHPSNIDAITTARRELENKP